MMVFLFESTRAVIKAEQICRCSGLDCCVIPVPRSVSAQCGMALEIHEDLVQKAIELMKGSSISIKIISKTDVRL